jgi:hypothetical protein
MVGLESDAVGVAERLGKFVVVVSQVLAQGDACKLETPATTQTCVSVTVLRFRGGICILPDQPEQPLGRGVGLGLELVPHKVLEILGFERSSQEAFPDFLCVDGIS